jgi:hypothetical protein
MASSTSRGPRLRALPRGRHRPVAVVLGASWLMASTQALGAPRIEVHGASRFDTQAAQANSVLTLSGSLLDDADRAIAGASITVEFVAEDGTTLQASSCVAAPPPLPPGDAAVGVLTTGPDGTFCARADARPGRIRIALTWAGTRLFAGARTDLSVDASRRAITLAFDPAPHVIALGEGALVLDAVAALATEGALPAPGLRLQLADERGAFLAEAATDGAGRARFVVPPNALGPPGPGELRLGFDGDPTNAAAEQVMSCERRVEVRVAVRAGASAVEEEDGPALDLEIRSATGELVSSGSVEGLFEGAAVGVARVAGGHAHLVVRWPAGAPTRLEVRYVPENTWYVAGPAARIDVYVQRSGRWRHALILLLGAGIVGVFVASRLRLRPSTSRRQRASTVVSELAHLDVIATHEDPRGGWDGRVVDAHDGGGIAGVLLALERPSFGGIETLLEISSDERGDFSLPATRVRPGDQLTAQGPFHGRFVGAIPSPGVLQLALVSRRRSLLRRLVRWARQRGQPFDAVPEPTPGHVRRAAGEDARTARWAQAVEEAAFGSRSVDAALEADVERLGPDAGPETSNPRRS